jgi:hypothetical protein
MAKLNYRYLVPYKQIPPTYLSTYVYSKEYFIRGKVREEKTYMCTLL